MIVEGVVILWFSYKYKFVFLQWLTIWLDRASHYIQNIVLLISFMMILMAIEMSLICWKLTYYKNELVNNYLLDFNFIWDILFVWDIWLKDSWNRVVLSSMFQIIFIKTQLEQTFLPTMFPISQGRLLSFKSCINWKCHNFIRL